MYCCIIGGFQLHSTQDSLNNRVEITEAKLRAVEMDHGMDIDTALVKLEEEQQRLVLQQSVCD